MRYILIYITAAFLLGCQEQKDEIVSISYICFVKEDTMFLKIKNNSSEAIFIPEKYVGTYNLGNDTIYLLSMDRPEYNTDKYYLYSKVLPFEFFAVNPIPEIIPDSVIVNKRQTYFFNQFIPPSFRRLGSNSDTTLQLSFRIPKQARILTAAYYETPFSNNSQIVRDTLDEFTQFVNFEKKHARYISTKAIMIIR